MVNIQAQIRLNVTPQRTAESLLVAPTPIMAPVMVWVVLTGIFNASVTNSVTAPAVSAATPSKGVTLVILVPIVFTIFQPPLIVPPAATHCTEANCRITGDRYPIGHLMKIGDGSACYQCSGNNTHYFLCIIASVADTKCCRRYKLQTLKPLVGFMCIQCTEV